MYKIFKDIEEYNEYTDNGQRLTSGVLYIMGDGKRLILKTNNIDGEFKVYDMIEPSGNIEITENGENIDVNDYATASVNVPQPTGNISITENGENIDIAQYATASVNVDAPAKDYIVEGAVYDPTATYSGEFKTINHITSATIPSGFTSIGGSAFKGCTSLTSVTIPNSVTSIGYSAFEKCSNLTSVTISDSVTSIGNQAFQDCSGLTNVTIGNGVTSIGNNAFMNCEGLTSITIPDSVTSIGNYAFYQCSSLTSVTIGNGVTSIDREAFRFCSVLTSVTIEAVTPPTLSSSNAFSNSNNCIIYVPTESLEAYKTATNWSSLASRIQAIA